MPHHILLRDTDSTERDTNVMEDTSRCLATECPCKCACVWARGGRRKAKAQRRTMYKYINFKLKKKNENKLLSENPEQSLVRPVECQ